MTFGEMQEAVYAWTKRPDKSTETRQAINDAILHFSNAASFSADLVEGTLSDPQVIIPTSYVHSIVISTNFPRFRKIKYFKPTGWKKYIKPLDSTKIFTPQECEQLDRWYRAGDRIQMKVSNLITSLEYGYYARPAKLILNADTHWMFDEIETAIKYRAVAIIFGGIGEQKEMASFLQLSDNAFLIAKNDLQDGDTPS